MNLVSEKLTEYSRFSVALSAHSDKIIQTQTKRLSKPVSGIDRKQLSNRASVDEDEEDGCLEWMTLPKASLVLCRRCGAALCLWPFDTLDASIFIGCVFRWYGLHSKLNAYANPNPLDETSWINRHLRLFYSCRIFNWLRTLP